MQKEFIPYEQALELKELGFDEPCFGWWFADEQMLIIEKSTKSTSENIVQAPLYQQASRWFREKYDMFSHLDKNAYSKYYYDIHNRGEIFFDEEYFNTPEEAELACLNKLIEIVKQ